MKTLVIIVVLLVIAGLAVGGGILYMNHKNNKSSNNSSSSANTSPDITTPNQGTSSNTSSGNDPSQQNTTGATDYTLQLTSFSFTPNTMTATAGQTLNVKLTNNDTRPHNFVINELNVQSDTLSPGQSGTVTINIPQDASGKTYQFYCSLPGHKDAGMVGQLTVQ